LALLEQVRPVLEASGNPARRYGFYLHLALARVMQHGYRVDESDIATMREGLAAAAQGDEEKDVGYATYFLGRLLWLHGDLAAAGEQMERSLAMAERIGESILIGQSVLGLALTALRRPPGSPVASSRRLRERTRPGTAASPGGPVSGWPPRLRWPAS
jgi:hypothetical protein